jgi:hypothetical protein
MNTDTRHLSTGNTWLLKSSSEHRKQVVFEQQRCEASLHRKHVAAEKISSEHRKHVVFEQQRCEASLLRKHVAAEYKRHESSEQTGSTQCLNTGNTWCLNSRDVRHLYTGNTWLLNTRDTSLFKKNRKHAVSEHRKQTAGQL